MAHISMKQLMQSALFAQNATDGAGRTSEADLIETQVYIGLNDAEAKRQLFDTERYVSVLKQVCVEYGVPFSFDVVEGGYIHDNGEYTEEKTIVLTLVDVEQQTVDEIAEDLCVFFRQESVLITTDQVKTRIIRGIVR